MCDGLRLQSVSYTHLDVYKRQELDGGKVNKDFVQQIVQTLGLDDRLDALPNQLSGGQQQLSLIHI